jgi:hypothetical protein
MAYEDIFHKNNRQSKSPGGIPPFRDFIWILLAPTRTFNSAFPGMTGPICSLGGRPFFHPGASRHPGQLVFDGPVVGWTHGPRTGLTSPIIPSNVTLMDKIVT